MRTADHFIHKTTASAACRVLRRHRAQVQHILRALPETAKVEA